MFTFTIVLRVLPSCRHFMAADKPLSPHQQIASISARLSFRKFTFPCVFLFVLITAIRLWFVFQHVPLTLPLESISRYFCIRYIFFDQRFRYPIMTRHFYFLNAPRLQTNLYITNMRGICRECLLFVTSFLSTMAQLIEFR